MFAANTVVMADIVPLGGLHKVHKKWLWTRIKIVFPIPCHVGGHSNEACCRVVRAFPESRGCPAVPLYDIPSHLTVATEIDLLCEALRNARGQEKHAKKALDMAKEVLEQYKNECDPGSSALKSVKDDYDILESSHADASGKVSAIVSRLRELGHEESGCA